MIVILEIFLDGNCGLLPLRTQLSKTLIIIYET